VFETVLCQGAWMTILPSVLTAPEETPGGGAGAGRGAFKSPVDFPVALPVCAPATCWAVALTFDRNGRSEVSRLSAGRTRVS
jgi:hypothetical protein